MKPAFVGVIHGYTMSYTISGAQIHTHISFGLSMPTPKASSPSCPGPDLVSALRQVLFFERREYPGDQNRVVFMDAHSC